MTECDPTKEDCNPLLKKKRSEIIEEIKTLDPECPPCMVDTPLYAAGEACSQFGGDRSKCEAVRKRFLENEISFREASDLLRTEGKSQTVGQIVEKAQEFLVGEVEELRKKKTAPAEGAVDG